MGNSADRAWQLSQLMEGVSTAFNPSHGSLSYVETNCVSFASAQARKLNHSVCFSFPHKVATLWGPQLWPDVVCPNRLGGMMQPATAAHGAFLARPSWGPRKAGRLCGERRSSVVIELSCLHGSERYVNRLGKHLIVARKNRPGFIANRIAAPVIVYNGLCLDVDGLTPQDIDLSMMKTGQKMGPMELADYTNIYVMYCCQDYYHDHLSPEYGRSAAAQKLIDEKHYGKVSGQGYYT